MTHKSEQPKVEEVVKERFGDKIDAERERANPPPLTDQQRAHNRQKLKGQ